MDELIYRLENVCYSYKGSRSDFALQNINFTVKEGELVYLLGPNGCGKSTLLSLMLGFFASGTGQIFIDNRDIVRWPGKELARRISWVPQSHKSSFAWTVEQMVLMGRIPHINMFFQPSAEDHRQVELALERLHITHLRDRFFHELSGGEGQLVLLARSIAQQCRVLLMDEPVSFLDFGNQLRFLELIGSLRSEGMTIIVTTHHPQHVQIQPGRVILMKKGSIVQTGDEKIINTEVLAELYDIPDNLMSGISMSIIRRP
jgi:iron complex transport system ATP-binding protein